MIHNDELRKRTEELAREKIARSSEDLTARLAEETRQTLPKRRVHQIELEMQNEELRRVQAELEDARTRYSDLYDQAPVGYCTLNEQGLILETDLPSPGPIVNTHANQIQQVLTNLVTKAWEAMGEVGGAIHVTFKTVSPDDIPALHPFPSGWQPQDKAHACLEVRNTGCGIAKKDIDKLFDPFFSSKFTGRGRET